MYIYADITVSMNVLYLCEVGLRVGQVLDICIYPYLSIYIYLSISLYPSPISLYIYTNSNTCIGFTQSISILLLSAIRAFSLLSLYQC